MSAVHDTNCNPDRVNDNSSSHVFVFVVGGSLGMVDNMTIAEDGFPFCSSWQAACSFFLSRSFIKQLPGSCSDVGYNPSGLIIVWFIILSEIIFSERLNVFFPLPWVLLVLIISFSFPQFVRRRLSIAFLCSAAANGKASRWFALCLSVLPRVWWRSCVDRWECVPVVLMLWSRLVCSHCSLL